jgi:hypothetical protein
MWPATGKSRRAPIRLRGAANLPRPDPQANHRQCLMPPGSVQRGRSNCSIGSDGSRPVASQMHARTSPSPPGASDPGLEREGWRLDAELAADELAVTVDDQVVG